MSHPENLLLPYVTGDLTSEDSELVREHVQTCSECRAAVSELVDMDARLRSLHPLLPATPLPLTSSRPSSMWGIGLRAVAALALVAAGAAGMWWWKRPAPMVQGGLYALVFYEPVAVRAVATDAQRRDRSQRFARWQRGMTTVTGVKLSDESGRFYESEQTVNVLDRRAGPGLAVSGFILIRADSYEAAAAVVPGCPVFDDGGRVEVRRVR